MATAKRKLPKVTVPSDSETSAKEQEAVVEIKEEKATPKKATKLVHIDDFIEAIRPVVDLSAGKASGFKAYMLGNHYLPSLEEFVPHLETYIGKEVKK